MTKQGEFEFVQGFPTTAIRYPPLDWTSADVTRFLHHMGLQEWLDKLQLLVDGLHPHNDLLTFKRQVEDLLNEDNIAALRALLCATHPGSGEEGESQDNDAG